MSNNIFDTYVKKTFSRVEMGKASLISIPIIFLLILFLIVGMSNISAADTSVYYTTTTNLNLRTGPGKDHRIILTLPKGTEVEIIARRGEWYQIKHLERNGFAYSKYLKYNRTVNTKTTTFQPFQNKTYFIIIVVFSAIVLLLVLIVYRKIRDRKLLKTVTKFNRGTRSERDLAFTLLKNKIPPDTIFHDLYLRKSNGGYSQTDLVVITDAGIIVFEVKDYSGWIYGNGNHSQWTQVLAYGKQKYRFYNPVKQNNRHIKVLKNQIMQLKEVPFFSVVVFYGDCELKEISFVPNGTFIVKANRVLEVLRIILKNMPAEYIDKHEVTRALQEAVKNGEKIDIQDQHIENIKDMLGKHRVFD